MPELNRKLLVTLAVLLAEATYNDGSGPQDLMPAIHSALQSIPQAACDHKGYYYDAAPPPFSDWLYLPWAGG